MQIGKSFKLSGKHRRVFSVLLNVVVLLFLYREMSDVWKNIDLVAMTRGVSYPILLVSMLVLIVSILSNGLVWKMILVCVARGKNNIPIAVVMDVQARAWLTKYIPGKIGVALYKILVGLRMGYKKRQVVYVSVIENVILVLSSFAVGMYGFISVYRRGFAGNEFLTIMASLVVVLVMIVVLTRENSLRKLLEVLVRKMRTINISGKNMFDFRSAIKIVSLSLLVRVISGVSFYLFVCSLIGPELVSGMFFELVSAFVLSGVIGLLAIFAPGGIGVREGVLIFILGGFWTKEVVIMIAILSRVWLVATDALLFMYSFLSSEKIKKI